MQTYERVERRPEEVRADGEALLDDEPAPLACRARQKDEAKRDGDEEPRSGTCDAAGGERSRRQGDGETARQQAHRADDRQIEHLFRRRTGEALADIEQVGDHEHGEERRLGHDKSDDARAPASGPATHGARPGRRDAARPTTAAGWSLRAPLRSCMREAASWWPIRASRLPRGCRRPARRGAASTRG